MARRPVGRDEFEIAIICALPLEADAVNYLFDEFFPNKYYKAAGDPNYYTNGRIGECNVVLVLLPGMGKVHAAGAAASLNASYTNLRLALLIGICGGVPGANRDAEEILLGDVIISNALVQFDFGRRYPGGLFLRKASVQDNLGRLNKDLRSLLRSLETDRCRGDLEKRTAELLHELQAAHAGRIRTQRQRDKYKYPGTAHDVLFEANYRHQHRGVAVTCCTVTDTCEAALQMSCEECGCDNKYLTLREQLNFKRELEQKDPIGIQNPVIHIGPVASGDTVMKSGEDRDRIAKEEGVLAFEMEGAGVWDAIPCIVIKGVCDYADSHKHKRWQDFAAATAAASMKALLEALVETEKPHPELQNIQAAENRTKPEAQPKPVAAEQTNKAPDQPPPRKLRTIPYLKDEVFKPIQPADANFMLRAWLGQPFADEGHLLRLHDLRDLEHMFQEPVKVDGPSHRDTLTLSRMTLDSFSAKSGGHRDSSHHEDDKSEFTTARRESPKPCDCYQIIELYSACRCLYYQHPVIRCPQYGREGHRRHVQIRTVLVGDACVVHTSHPR